MDNNDSHKELFNKIKAGDKQALEKVFELYFNSLCAFSFKYLNDIEDAKDVVHDIFIKIWQNRKKIKIESSLKSYLFKATQNNSIKLLNKKRIINKYREGSMKTHLIDGYSKIEDPYLQKIIYDAIDLLPDKCKKITYDKKIGCDFWTFK